jgi:hypothetical protein
MIFRILAKTQFWKIYPPAFSGFQNAVITHEEYSGDPAKRSFEETILEF